MKRPVSALLLVAVAGCGPATGDLEGQVLFKNQPMVTGTVTLIASDNQPRQCVIDGGAYKFLAVPVGEAKFLVSGPDQLPHPSWPKDREPYVRRPDREKPPEPKPAPTPGQKRQPLRHVYALIDETPLRVTVNTGKNQHDIKVD